MIGSAGDDRDVEALEVFAELRPDGEGAREGLEVEAVLRWRKREPRSSGKRLRGKDSRCGTIWTTSDRLQQVVSSVRLLRADVTLLTLDECVVSVERRQVIAFLDGELAPLQLASNRVAVVEDEHVLQGTTSQSRSSA